MLNKILQSINPIKNTLIVGSVLFSCVLIILNNNGLLPIALGDFVFFSLIVFLFSLYRPSWVFLFFIGALPLEIVNIAPPEFGMMLRPYQWLGILTLVAVVTLRIVGRLSFTLPKMNRLDWLLCVVWTGSFITALIMPNKSVNLKQSVVLFSFILLYALTRMFIRTISDVKNISAFFVGSGVIVSTYAIWQNTRFASGLNAFEVMAGRPNSVFTEPDWLGAFLVVCISALYVIILRTQKTMPDKNSTLNFLGRTIHLNTTLHHLRLLVWYGLLALAYIALILSVSRSAWLSVAVLTLVAWCAIVIDSKIIGIVQGRWRESIIYAMGIMMTGIISIATVFVFHLTSFQLFNRVQSVASGLQLITIACEQDTVMPDTINSTDELAQYGCRHIDLEEKNQSLQNGEIVKELYRNDPNVDIRRSIYMKTLSIIHEHFLIGIGFGSIHSVLGNDERGAGLNASNIFLEVWLGSGIIGLLAFAFVWLSIGIASMRRLLVPQTNTDLTMIHYYIFLSWIGLTIFNLFNAGIFLGFFWVWLGIVIGLAGTKQ